MNHRVFACVALYFGVLYGGAPAQPNSPIPAVSPDLRDRPEGFIKLDIMVTDRAGNPVSGLLAPDFRLFESGREQKILSFQAFTGTGAGTEPPVKVILLIDTLEVPGQVARDEREAVTFYLRKNGGRLTRPTSVFLLSGSGLWTVRHGSGDGNILARDLNQDGLILVRRNGAGELGPRGSEESPVEWRLKALGQIATVERRQPGRKLLLWVGPGWGTGSGTKRELETDPALYGTICWFSTLLREAHLVLYSFSGGETDARGQLYKGYLAGVSSPKNARVINLDRNVLSVQSGGRVVEGIPQEIESQIENCVRDTSWFYRITFDPFAAEHLDEYHDLKVETDRPGLMARTNTGYYDQPYYSTDQIPPLKQLSLAELQAILERDESDAAKANQLKGAELTRRLSERRLATLFSIAHGKRTRHELRILADASSFLDPPIDEILAVPTPSPDEQERIISMASSYLATAIHQLPDYFARRITTRYQETAMDVATRVKYQPLHQTDRSTTTVRYRHGREDSDARFHWLRLGNPELITTGVFGPALQDAFNTIKKNGRLTWVRWEQVTGGRAAVFRSTIPVDQSLRDVWVCCLPDRDGRQAYQRYAAYHVQIAIDPETGAILRLSYQFDLKSTAELTRSDIMIEYGPVQIGGKTYDCPFRSVSINRARSLRVLSDWDESFMSYGPFTTMMNDISFDRYHMFRSESRILNGFTPAEK
jgi:VWFA-related protein